MQEEHAGDGRVGLNAAFEKDVGTFPYAAWVQAQPHPKLCDGPICNKDASSNFLSRIFFAIQI